MAEVRLYVTRFCGYCVAAKRLLGARKVAFEEVDVTGDAAMRAWLVKATGRRTVPQVFVGGNPIGGYEELAALERSGELATMLRGESGQGEREGPPPQQPGR
jgi:glutaredoxin 3